MERKHYFALAGFLILSLGTAATLVRSAPTSRWPSGPAHRFYSPSGARLVFDYQPNR
jgi:hypothetical protein